jgi:GH25 family lysozyme M1 (1,4-beta-N-acetylmuramidase)
MVLPVPSDDLYDRPMGALLAPGLAREQHGDIVRTIAERSPLDILLGRTPPLLKDLKSWPRIVDLSHWNTVISFAVMFNTDKVESVVLRTSYGATGRDTKFTSFWQGALGARIPIQIYHFFRSDMGGATQADNMWAAALPLIVATGIIPPIWLDVESADGASNTQRINRMKAFFDRIVALAATVPHSNQLELGIYTAPWFANANIFPVPSWINNYWHWIAHWIDPFKNNIVVPTGWNKLLVHQKGIWNDHPWCLSMQGAAADIDQDDWHGTSLLLRQFAPLPPPPPPPPPLPPPTNPPPPPSTPRPRPKLISTGPVKVRTGPGVTYKEIKTLPKGTIVNPVSIRVKSTNEIWSENNPGEFSAIVYFNLKLFEEVLDK